MGILDRLSKSWEKGKQEARQDAADRQGAKEARREDFNKAMDRSDAKQEKHWDLADKARQRGDMEGYQEHLKKADDAGKMRQAYKDPD